jgi:DNA-directed RNA polymerase specialized sigma24 family protein
MTGTSVTPLSATEKELAEQLYRELSPRFGDDVGVTVVDAIIAARGNARDIRAYVYETVRLRQPELSGRHRERKETADLATLRTTVDPRPGWTAHEILNRLPAELREIATAHWIAGESLRDLAARLGTTEKTIRVRLNRARHLTKGLLDDCHAQR